MFGHKHYVPMLRWKRGERIALRELFHSDRSAMTPLVESPSNDDTPPDEIVAQVAKSWGSSPMFFDLSPAVDRLQSVCDTHPVVDLFKNARNLGLQLIPVTELRHTVEYQTAVQKVLSIDNQGACLRLSRKDLKKPTLHAELDALCEFLGLQPNKVDLVIDLHTFVFDPNIYTGLPNLSQWRTLTIASGSFPKDLSGLSVGKHFLPRMEWQSWRNQLSSSLLRLPTYSDYATLHPVLSQPFPGMNISASIRYTTSEHWLIMRGEGLRNKDGPGYAQYPANAELLISYPEYCGSSFSFGDNYIYHIALNKEKPGNPTTWVTAGVNHHLTFTVRQIADSFGA